MSICTYIGDLTRVISSMNSSLHQKNRSRLQTETKAVTMTYSLLQQNRMGD